MECVNVWFIDPIVKNRNVITPILHGVFRLNSVCLGGGCLGSASSYKRFYVEGSFFHYTAGNTSHFPKWHLEFRLIILPGLKVLYLSVLSRRSSTPTSSSASFEVLQWQVDGPVHIWLDNAAVETFTSDLSLPETRERLCSLLPLTALP